ncbi:Hypothetical_protein [Hexamita inflata]|uniref:Hypothetical_protein n=1 Tax=Hexamita inflata TaxID=28002 RepID=A0ABP1IAK4_9EUKA
MPGARRETLDRLHPPLNFPANGNLQLPLGNPGIFHIQVQQEHHDLVRLPDLASYDLTLTRPSVATNLLLDNDICHRGSVADVFHTRSNQTSCSSVCFTYSLPDNWYAFEVQPGLRLFILLGILRVPVRRI